MRRARSRSGHTRLPGLALWESAASGQQSMRRQVADERGGTDEFARVPSSASNARADWAKTGKYRDWGTGARGIVGHKSELSDLAAEVLLDDTEVLERLVAELAIVLSRRKCPRHLFSRRNCPITHLLATAIVARKPRSPIRQGCLYCSGERLEIVVGQLAVAHDAALRARFQISVSVNRDGDPTAVGMREDVMATGNSFELPAAFFQYFAHPFARDRLHGCLPRTAASWAHPSHPSIASRRLSRTSSSVSPSV